MGKTNKKVLIVEDDKSFLWIIRQAFDAAGFAVFFGQDGQEGLKMVQEEKPDLILLDILMPKMDGIQVAQKLRQEGINTPIIFLTNMSDVDHMSQATEIAPSEYIIKADMPIDKIVARVKEKLGIK